MRVPLMHQMRRVPAPKEDRKPKGYGAKPRDEQTEQALAVLTDPDRTDWFIAGPRRERDDW